MSKYGLDDWKFALPIGMLFGMPVIANEVRDQSVTTTLSHDRSCSQAITIDPHRLTLSILLCAFVCVVSRVYTGLRDER